MSRNMRRALIVLFLILTVSVVAACQLPSPTTTPAGAPTSTPTSGLEHATGAIPNPNAPKAVVTGGVVPSAVDLTQYDPPVRNQNGVNSCVAWALDYYLRGWYAQRDRYYPPGGFAPMSVYAQVVQGQNIGTGFPHNLNILRQQGVNAHDDYSPGDTDYTTQPTADQIAHAIPYTIIGYMDVGNPGGSNFQLWIENVLAAGDPIALMIPVYPEFDRVSAATSWLVSTPKVGETQRGTHAVFASKYDTSGLWIKNSWGTWGASLPGRGSGYAELSWAFVNQYAYEAATMVPSPPPADLMVKPKQVQPMPGNAQYCDLVSSSAPSGLSLRVTVANVGGQDTRIGIPVVVEIYRLGTWVDSYPTLGPGAAATDLFPIPRFSGDLSITVQVDPQHIVMHEPHTNRQDNTVNVTCIG